MKKTIPNPEYEKATVSLGWIVSGKLGAGDHGPRFKTWPPQDIYRSQSALNQWIAENAIHPAIEVEA